MLESTSKQMPGASTSKTTGKALASGINHNEPHSRFATIISISMCHLFGHLNTIPKKNRHSCRKCATWEPHWVRLHHHHQIVQGEDECGLCQSDSLERAALRHQNMVWGWKNPRAPQTEDCAIPLHLYKITMLSSSLAFGIMHLRDACEFITVYDSCEPLKVKDPGIKILFDI